MLRNNVKTHCLETIVLQLSLPEARRISIETFFEDSNYTMRYKMEKYSAMKFSASSAPYRGYGFHGDAVLNKLACTSIKCALCLKQALELTATMLATVPRRARRFSVRFDRFSKRRNARKGGKPAASRGKSSSSISSAYNHSTSTSIPLNYYG